MKIFTTKDNEVCKIIIKEGEDLYLLAASIASNPQGIPLFLNTLKRVSPTVQCFLNVSQSMSLSLAATLNSDKEIEIVICKGKDPLTGFENLSLKEEFSSVIDRLSKSKQIDFEDYDYIDSDQDFDDDRDLGNNIIYAFDNIDNLIDVAKVMRFYKVTDPVYKYKNHYFLLLNQNNYDDITCMRIDIYLSEETCAIKGELLFGGAYEEDYAYRTSGSFDDFENDIMSNLIKEHGTYVANMQELAKI